MLWRSRNVTLDDNDETGNGDIAMGRLWRLAYWGGAAAFMLMIAVIAGRTETGIERIRMAIAPENAPAFDAQAATERLSGELQKHTADRAQLRTRLSLLERNLDDVTGSVKRELEAARAAAAAKPKPAPAAPLIAPVASAPAVEAPASLPAIPADKDKPKPAAQAPAKPPAETANKPKPAGTPSRPKMAAPALPVPRPGAVIAARSSGGPLTVALSPLQAAPKDTPPSPPSAIDSDFGIDIGSGTTMSALRAQWETIKRAHPKLLDGLRPIVSIRDVAKRRRVELRLLVGPIANPGAAAKRCAALVSAGLQSCKTAVFEGQRLTIR